MSHAQLPASDPASLFPFTQASVGWSVAGVAMGISGLVDTALCRSKLPESAGSSVA